MTILEAVLALVIAFGVIASAIAASRLAIERATLAGLDAEAMLDAEALSLRVGRDLALDTGHAEGADDNGMRWTVDVAAIGVQIEAPAAYAVMSDVTISRAGLSAHGHVATLKLQWPGQ